jgi:hypothetical protein
MTTTDAPLAYSVAGASRATGIGITLLRAELKAGRLAKRYLNSKVVILRDDLASFLEALPRSVADAASDGKVP